MNFAPLFRFLSVFSFLILSVSLFSVTVSASDLHILSPSEGSTFYSGPFELSWSLVLPENETLSNFSINISNNISSRLFSAVTHSTNYTVSESDLGLSDLENGRSSLISWSVTASLEILNQSNLSESRQAFATSSSSFHFVKPWFNLYLDADNVSVNSTLVIRLSAPHGTSSELNIAGPSVTDTYFTPVDEDTALIYIPTEPGSYTVSASFSFMDYSVSRTVHFTAYSRSSSNFHNDTNTSSSKEAPDASGIHLSVSVETSKDEISKGSAMHFKAVAKLLDADNNPVNESVVSACNITYSWKVGDSAPVVSPSDSFSYTFARTGYFEVSLVATASCHYGGIPVSVSGGNSVSVHVIKPSFDVAVRVVESFTRRPVSEAVLLLKSASPEDRSVTLLKTNSHGTATLHLKEGEYSLNISKEGYENTTATLTVVKPDVFTFTLFKEVKKSVLPNVKLINTPSSVSSPDPSITIAYSAQSDTPVTECMIFYQLESFRGWRLGGKQKVLLPGVTYSFTLQSLQSGTYRYRIKCVDADRDSGFSPIKKFSVVNEREEKMMQLGASFDGSPDSSSVELLLKRFDDAIVALSSLSGTRREIVDALALLQSAKQKKKRAREIYDSYKNYKEMGLSDELLFKKMEETKSQIKSLLDSVAFNVLEIQDHEFISVSDSEHASAMAGDFLRENSLSLSEENMRRYLSAVMQLNDGLDIYTRATLMEIRLGSGHSEYVTLLKEDLQLPPPVESAGDVVLAVKIPASLSNRDSSRIYSDIVSLNRFKLLDSSGDRTFISVSLDESADDSRYPYEAAFIIPSSDTLNADELEKLQAALMYQNIDLSSKSSFGSGITGFAVLDSSGVKLRTMVSEILIIIVALSLSLFIYSKYVSPPGSLSVEDLSKKLSSLFETSEHLMKSGDVSSFALKTFEKTLSLYREAPPIVRSMFFDRFRALWDYVNFHSAKERIKQAYSFLVAGDAHRAGVALMDARRIVDSLPYEFRKDIISHLNDAEKMLSSSGHRGSSDSGNLYDKGEMGRNS